MFSKDIQKLMSEDSLTLKEGLDGLAARVPQLEGTDLEQAVQALVGLFYVDGSERPDLAPLAETAETILADAGPKVIPLLLAALGETDLKTHFHIANVLGALGHGAVSPLLAAYPSLTSDYARTFLLYALGKVRDRRVLDAIPLMRAELKAGSPEVRDTAARALGKVCESVNPDDISSGLRGEMFDALIGQCGDTFAGVRSKAMRSLGKMARFGLLDKKQKERLSGKVASVLGETADDWDMAYIVRAEATRAKAWL